MLMSAVYSPHPESPPLQCLFTSSGRVSARPAVAGSSDSSEQQIGAIVQQGGVVTIIWRRAIPYKDSVALFFLPSSHLLFTNNAVSLLAQYSTAEGERTLHAQVPTRILYVYD